MPDLSFDVTHIYASTDGIEIPLVISFGGKEVQTSGYADCGAEACIFSNEIGQMLAKRDRRVAGMSAPAHGLVLWKVFYS